MITKLGKRIKEEREVLGMSQVDLAKKLDIVSQTVSGWEGSRRLPDVNTLSTLSDMFGCSLDYLIGKTDNRTAAVIEQMVGNDNIKIEMDKDYLSKLTPTEVREFLKDLQNAGFDLDKLTK